MRGRARGERERTIILAHQIEAMAREKRLKPLAKYLDQAKPKQAGSDNFAVIAMFEELAAKGGNVVIRRVKRPDLAA
jgi:hypothetical protein